MIHLKTRHLSLWFICTIAIGLFMCSCAHRSGHSSRNGKSSRARSEVRPELSSRMERKATKKLEGREIYRRCKSSVFLLFSDTGDEIWYGGGFFIGSDGLAVTNYHVFANTSPLNSSVKLYGSDTPYKIKEVLKADEDEDFVIFRIDYDNMNYIPLASKKPEVGDKVYAIGCPEGLESTFSSGNVSGWRENDLMQISIPLDYGSSGGPLLNEYGEAVGLPCLRLVGNHADLNFAISVEAFKPYLQY